MAKLSKPQMKLHNKAEALLQNDVLTQDDKEYIFENWNEAFSHDVSYSGAFFTPLDLAYDAALELGYPKNCTVIDLCAGIGVLSYAAYQRFKNGIDRLVCVEANPRYVEIGKKLLPEAEWHCLDIANIQEVLALGEFDFCLSNPPFGKVKSLNHCKTFDYQGGEAEYKIIDIASHIADYGVFILPQESAGFRYSGTRNFQRNENSKYNRFSDQTGLMLTSAIGIDTCMYAGFKNTSIRVEIASCDFRDREGQLLLA